MVHAPMAGFGRPRLPWGSEGLSMGGFQAAKYAALVGSLNFLYLFSAPKMEREGDDREGSGRWSPAHSNTGFSGAREARRRVVGGGFAIGSPGCFAFARRAKCDFHPTPYGSPPSVEW